MRNNQYLYCILQQPLATSTPQKPTSSDSLPYADDASSHGTDSPTTNTGSRLKNLFTRKKPPVAATKNGRDTEHLMTLSTTSTLDSERSRSPYKKRVVFSEEPPSPSKEFVEVLQRSKQNESDAELLKQESDKRRSKEGDPPFSSLFPNAFVQPRQTRARLNGVLHRRQATQTQQWKRSRL
jgi:hypothetical protein